jgi:uncharacterized repeat protein (TIGR03806 family)
MLKNLNICRNRIMGRPRQSKVRGGDRSSDVACRSAGPLAALLVASAGCSSGHDETQLLLLDLGRSTPGATPFLGLPPTVAESDASPERLSLTLAFSDLASLETAPGILPYAVQSPLWSDGAQKRRYVALPSGSHVGFSEHGAWTFPEGTVFIKHFGMALDERTPERVERLETRFLVAARGGGYYGLVYKWDADQRDARLLLDGAEDVLDIIQADGSVRQQRYTYPSQRACSACHSPALGYVMGPRTAQLNGEFEYRTADGGVVENQLATWLRLDLFDTPAGEVPPGDIPVSEHQHLAPLDDESATLESRVRSYWDSNCSACHNDTSPIPSWDARFSTPLDDQGVLLAEPYTGPRSDGARLIVPGDAEHSLIYLRSLSIQPGMRMPPILRNRTDERYVELLGRWIESLAGR